MVTLFQALSTMEEFHNLDRDIEGSAKRWKKFAESECPDRKKTRKSSDSPVNSNFFYVIIIFLIIPAL